MDTKEREFDISFFLFLQYNKVFLLNFFEALEKFRKLLVVFRFKRKIPKKKRLFFWFCFLWTSKENEQIFVF